MAHQFHLGSQLVSIISGSAFSVFFCFSNSILNIWLHNIKVIEHPFEINKSYYDLELCGNIEIITNLIKEKIRDIKLSEIL